MWDALNIEHYARGDVVFGGVALAAVPAYRCGMVKERRVRRVGFDAILGRDGGVDLPSHVARRPPDAKPISKQKAMIAQEATFNVTKAEIIGLARSAVRHTVSFAHGCFVRQCPWEVRLMLNNKQGNVFVVAAVVIVTVAVIVGVSLLVFGEFLIPLMQEAMPYSYLTVLVVILAAIFFLS